MLNNNGNVFVKGSIYRKKNNLFGLKWSFQIKIILIKQVVLIFWPFILSLQNNTDWFQYIPQSYSTSFITDVLLLSTLQNSSIQNAIMCPQPQPLLKIKQQEL